MTTRRLVPMLCILCLFCAGLSMRRTKRELRFPKGTSFVVAVAAVTFLPKGPTDGLAHFVEFDLGFPFPDKFAIGRTEADKRVSWKPSYEKIMKKNGWKGGKVGKRRGKRNLKEEERKQLIWKLEDAINRLGFNGKNCTRRFLCELRYISSGNSLLEKLLTALFTTSGLSDEDCERFVRACPVSLLHVLTHSQHVSGL